MRKFIIIFAVIGVCMFIAATTYSRMLRDNAAEELAKSNADTPPAAFADPQSIIDKAKTLTLKRSVPEGAVKVKSTIYGSAEAPLILEEFASFSCSHCADFHRVLLPQVKRELIDTGIVQLHVYSFLRNRQDLDATLLVQCQADNAGRKGFTASLMRAQEQWTAGDYRENLKTIARVGGMDEASFEACLTNAKLEEHIIQSRQWIDQNVKADATPYFRLGDQVIKGTNNLESFVDAVKQAVNSTPENEKSKP